MIFFFTPTGSLFFDVMPQAQQTSSGESETEAPPASSLPTSPPSKSSEPLASPSILSSFATIAKLAGVRAATPPQCLDKSRLRWARGCWQKGRTWIWYASRKAEQSPKRLTVTASPRCSSARESQ